MISGSDNSLVINEQEHQHIQKIAENGGGLVSLRNGKLGFHTTGIKLFKETDALTDEEEQRVRDIPQIAEVSKRTEQEKRKTNLFCLQQRKVRTQAGQN